MCVDKFVIITDPSRVEAITHCAQKLFTEARDGFYQPTEREQGFIAIVDRQGRLAHVGLCALDFDVVSSQEP